MSSELIITKRRGIGWYAGWASVLVTMLLVTFYLGRLDSRAERLSLISERGILVSQVEEYEQQLTELQQQKIMLESSAQVDATASSQIMETISTLQQNIDVLETELSFYRGIMAPEKDVKGLQLADFTLEPASQNRTFRFQLALTQAKTHEIFLKGVVAITIVGKSKGVEVQQDVLDISTLERKDLGFTFKYFQHIKGELTLPEGFLPEKIQVTATIGGRKPQTVSKDYPWTVS